MNGHDTAGAANSLHYESDDGLCRIACQIHHGRVWLTVPAIAALHRTTEQNVARQLKAAFCGRRLGASSMLKAPAAANAGLPNDHVTRYGVDAVLAVGERLGSSHGVAFARWVNACLAALPARPSP